jgi:hypothetical protein
MRQKGCIYGSTKYFVTPLLSTSTSITAFLTLGIVFLMTLKPGWLGSLGFIAGALVVAASVALVFLRAGREPRIGEQVEPVEMVRL